MLYVGVTANLVQRIQAHRSEQNTGFTARYNIYKLVWTEHFPTMTEAIAAEKTLKHYSRSKKIKLVTQDNPEWQDLMPPDVE